MTYRCLNWNIRGVTNGQKARQVLAYLDRHNIDIVFLQETHCPLGTTPSFGIRWATQRFFASYSTYTRGVAILIRKSVSFQLIKCVSNPLGRMLMVAGTISGVRILMLNTYRPNVDDPDFIEACMQTTQDFRGWPALWRGDFNLVRDPLMDSTSTRRAG